MTKEEYIKNLQEMVYDVNAAEIASHIENDSLSSADIEYNIKGTTDGGDYRGQINIYGSTDGVTWSASPLYSTPIFSDETYHTGTGTFDATGYKYLSAKGYATGGNYLYNCTAKITF